MAGAASFARVTGRPAEGRQGRTALAGAVLSGQTRPERRERRLATHMG